MNLNELSPVVARKARKRIGRGNASGQAKTAGKDQTDKNQDLEVIFILNLKGDNYL